MHVFKYTSVPSNFVMTPKLQCYTLPTPSEITDIGVQSSTGLCSPPLAVCDLCHHAVFPCGVVVWNTLLPVLPHRDTAGPTPPVDATGVWPCTGQAMPVCGAVTQDGKVLYFCYSVCMLCVTIRSVN